MNASSSGRSMVVLLSVLCLFLPGLADLPAVAATAELSTGGLVLILDASGSMMELIEGRRKIDIAKEVLTETVHDLPHGIDVQLVVYGNRMATATPTEVTNSLDCRAVETLIPLGPLDKTNLLAKIAAMQPGGKTPIMHAIRTVADGLGGVADATIMLVSDGRDTCGGDPCAAVKELKEQGIGFVMHVIGFGRNEREMSQLACVGEAGGGLYFAATNAAGFKFAAETVLQKTGESAGYLRIVALHKGVPAEAPCRIVRAGAAADAPAIASGTTGAEGSTFKLLPGVYDVIIENPQGDGAPPVRLDGVVVETGRTAERTTEFSVPTLVITTLRNGRPFVAACQVFRAESGEWVDARPSDAGGLAGFDLEPGAYDVEVRNELDLGSQPAWHTNVVIAADSTVAMTNDFAGGTLTLATWLRGRPVEALCQVSPSGAGVRYFGRSHAGVAEFNLVPGTYDVLVTTEDGTISREMPGVAVRAGETQALEISLDY